MKLYSKIFKLFKYLNIQYKYTKIFTSIFFANLAVGLDLLIINLLINYFGVEISLFFSNYFANLFEYRYSLILLIFARFGIIISENFIRESLRTEADKQVKNNEIQKLFFKNNYSPSEINYSINIEASEIGVSFRDFISVIVNFIQFLLFFTYLIYTNTDMVLFFSLFMVVIALPLSKLRNQTSKNSDSYQKSIKLINEKILNIIKNHFFFKLNDETNKEFDNFKTEVGKYKESYIKLGILGVANYHAPTHLALTAIGLVFVLFNSESLKNLEFIFLCLRIFQNLGGINFSLHLLKTKQPFVENYLNKNIDFELDNLKNNLFIVSSNLDTDEAYVVTDLNFKFQGQNDNLFQNFNFKIERNSHTIISGNNGVGKSTLVGLLSNVYVPNSGYIKAYSNVFGYVGSKPFIIRGTLKENCNYGIKNIIDDRQVFDIIKKLDIFENIDEEILNLQVSNEVLSSGQMQKIAFTRVLLKNPEIIFLDEAFTNLDKSSSEKIRSLVFSQKRTIIEVNHSLEYKNESSNLLTMKRDNNGLIVIS